MRRISFYTRDNCCLCRDAKAALAEIQQDHPFELEVIDLDEEAGAEKRAAYTDEVPVVELDGRKIMKYRVDAERLIRLLSL